MQRKLIFILVFMVLIAIFALQNSEEAEIRLWFWSLSTSMALVLILTFAAGAIAGILFSITGKRGKASRPTLAEDPDVAGGDVSPEAQGDDAGKKAANGDEFEDLIR